MSLLGRDIFAGVISSVCMQASVWEKTWKTWLLGVPPLTWEECLRWLDGQDPLTAEVLAQAAELMYSLASDTTLTSMPSSWQIDGNHIANQGQKGRQNWCKKHAESRLN